MPVPQDEIEFRFRPRQWMIADPIPTKATHAFGNNGDASSDGHQREHRVHSVRFLRNPGYKACIRAKADNLQMKTAAMSRPLESPAIHHVDDIMIILQSTKNGILYINSLTLRCFLNHFWQTEAMAWWISTAGSSSSPGPVAGSVSRMPDALGSSGQRF